MSGAEITLTAVVAWISSRSNPRFCRSTFAVSLASLAAQGTAYNQVIVCSVKDGYDDDDDDDDAGSDHGDKR